MESQHRAQKVCGLGVLPLTKTNFICRLLPLGYAPISSTRTAEK
jgi:hypothetical protein